MPVTPGTTYFIGGKFLSPSGSESIQTTYNSDSNCSVFLDFGPSVQPAAGLPGWTTAFVTWTAPATAHSLLFMSYICNSNMDQLFVNSAAASF